MSIYKDIKGQRFGRWIVLHDAGRDDHQNVIWKAQCDCGNKGIVIGSSLRNGKSKSCGCLKKESYRIKIREEKTNKIIYHPLYHVLYSMERRCYNKDRKDYYKYGARGIGICEEWRMAANSFIKWGISHGWKKGLQIDRVDNDKGYSPDNCRFVTAKENCRNTRRNVFVQYNDFYGTISELAEKIGMDAVNLHNRIRTLGWDIDKAVTTPIRKRPKSKLRIMEGRVILSEDLKHWRAERPDEWTMDDFIRKAKLLEETSEIKDKIIATQQESIDTLKELITLNKGE